MKKIADKGASEAFLRAHVNSKEVACILWPYRLVPAGYGLAVIGGVQKRASRWMCILAHGNPPTLDHHAAHSCGNASCVNPNHPRWATPAENMADKNIHGTSNHGPRNGKTSLTEDDVRAIRAAPPTLAPLMAKYGMSRDGIRKIRSRQRWGHVQ